MDAPNPVAGRTWIERRVAEIGICAHATFDVDSCALTYEGWAALAEADAAKDRVIAGLRGALIRERSTGETAVASGYAAPADSSEPPDPDNEHEAADVDALIASLAAGKEQDNAD